MTDDRYSGTPRKLKDIDLTSLEKRFAAIVDEIVHGEGKIRADINFIDFCEKGIDGIMGTVEMKIRFSKEMDLTIPITEKGCHNED